MGLFRWNINILPISIFIYNNDITYFEFSKKCEIDYCEFVKSMARGYTFDFAMISAISKFLKIDEKKLLC